MKRSTLFVGAALAALLACKSQPADAGTSAPSATIAESAGTAADSAVPLDDAVNPKRAAMKSSMKALNNLKADKNFDGLKSALDALKGKGLPGMDGWDGFADAGAKAAAAKDIDGVEKSCKSCHGAFKKRFKDESGK